MKPVRRDIYFALALLLVLALAGCSGQKDAAGNFVAEVASAVAAAQPEAAKYIPVQLEDIQAKLTGLQASYDKEDYAGVMASAPGVLAGAQSLATDSAAKKDQILKDENDRWSDLAAVLPDEVFALQALLESPGKKPAKKAIRGFDPATAQSIVADLTSNWSRAQAAFADGNLEEALGIAQDVKTRADRVELALKMKVAPATGAN